LEAETVNIDRSLVLRLKESDNQAFEKLFNKYNKKVFYFALRYNNSKEDAEGVVQDVFIKIWNERKTLKEDLSFNSYVFTITKNHLFNMNRKKLNEKAYREFFIHHYTRIDNKPEENIIYSDLKQKIDDIIDDLPAQRKKIFIMSRREGLSNKEIAGKLGLSVRTVEVHISLALKTIKKFSHNLLN
jgi:RNA polymerase sigma-19 factor, ECF subfamily